MKKNNLEIGNSVYTGVCIYNSLRKRIVEIDRRFVSLEEKIPLSLYLGILHSQNSISSLLEKTELVRGTKIDYKKLDSKEFCELYDLYFKDVIYKMNIETLEDYFKILLENNIVVKLNNEYDVSLSKLNNLSNKALVKK